MSGGQFDQLNQQLRTLHLSAVLAHYRQRAQEAAQRDWSFEEYLASLIGEESERRTTNRLQRRIKEARFPLPKELVDFDFSATPSLPKQRILALAQGNYIDAVESVIMVGNPGLGKTHVAIGLGLAACRQDYRVRFYNVTALVNELHQAQAHHQLPHYLDKLLRHQLIILDEFGYVPFSTTGAQLLFQFCSALHEQVSVILTTNLPFGDWGQVLGDERLTSGLLDRMTARSQILEFVGESFRFRQRLALETEEKPIKEKRTGTNRDASPPARVDRDRTAG